MKPQITVKGKKVSVYYTRPATKSERAKNKDSKVMAEWVYIEFSDKAPKITVNRDLCGD